MKKKTLIIAASCVVILLAATFLPPILWNVHLQALTKKTEIQIIEQADNMRIINSEEFARLYSSGVFLGGNDYNDSTVEAFEQLKEMIANIFSYLEPEAKDFYMDVLATSNYEYSNSHTVSISTETGPEYFTLVDGAVNYYEGEDSLNFFIGFELKTQTIILFAMYSQTGDVQMKYAKELSEAVRKYYSNLGMSDKYYEISFGDYDFICNLHDGYYTDKFQYEEAER